MRNLFGSKEKQNTSSEVFLLFFFSFFFLNNHSSQELTKKIVGEYPKIIQFFIRKYEMNPNPTYGEVFFSLLLFLFLFPNTPLNKRAFD